MPGHKAWHFLEDLLHPIPCVIAAQLQGPVQRMLAVHRQWIEVEDGIEVASVLYAANGWSTESRMVMVRRRVSRRLEGNGQGVEIVC